MKLLTEEVHAQLPPLYSQEKNDDPMVHCKFFKPWSNWTWFVTEGEPDEEDFRFFGYVCGHEEEWGYFVLSELETVRGPAGLTIERDLYFSPARFSEVIASYRHARGQFHRQAVRGQHRDDHGRLCHRERQRRRGQRLPSRERHADLRPGRVGCFYGRG